MTDNLQIDQSIRMNGWVETTKESMEKKVEQREKERGRESKLESKEP